MGPQSFWEDFRGLWDELPEVSQLACGTLWQLFCWDRAVPSGLSSACGNWWLCWLENGTGEPSLDGWCRCCSVLTCEWSFKVHGMAVPEHWLQTGQPPRNWKSTTVHLMPCWSFTPLFENNSIRFKCFTPKKGPTYPVLKNFLWLGERKSCKDHRVTATLST